jgi:hypothetical protein
MSVLESFRTVRWLRTLNLLIQAVLFLTFFGGLNYVARNHVSRFDLTHARKFSLSPETLSFIKNLKSPVHIIVTVSRESENPMVQGLIEEYVYNSADSPGKITKENIDLYQDRRRAEEVGIDTADVIVLMSGDRRRVVAINELYTFKDRKRDAFQGEQVLTGAILQVSEPVQLKIYFLAGHSELRIDDPDAMRGLTAVRDQLKLRSFEVDTLDLTVARTIPADAALLVCVAPQGQYKPPEQEMLRQYLATSAGRMIFLLSPGARVSELGLESLLLDDWGVLVYNDYIIDPENMADNADLFIRYYTPEHPITKMLIGQTAPLRMGAARTVIPDPGRSLTGLNTVTLAATSTSAWGEVFRRGPIVPKKDPGVDTLPIPGLQPADRLGVIVASERVGVRDNLPFSVRGGKIVVFGTGDLVANSRIDHANLAAFLNAVNWTVDRDHQLKIPPRPIEHFQLSLTTGEFMQLRYVLLLGLPGATLLLGMLVYWTRRR